MPINSGGGRKPSIRALVISAVVTCKRLPEQCYRKAPLVFKQSRRLRTLRLGWRRRWEGISLRPATSAREHRRSAASHVARTGYATAIYVRDQIRGYGLAAEPRSRVTRCASSYGVGLIQPRHERLIVKKLSSLKIRRPRSNHSRVQQLQRVATWRAARLRQPRAADYEALKNWASMSLEKLHRAL